MNINNPYIIQSAEPFFFPGDSTGCLLVHGFTGTPSEMRPLGEYLAEQGYSVMGIRLAGHATQPTDMMRMRWWDWIASVEDGINMLRTCTKRIFVIGLSMGGILTLISAARYSIHGAVALSTPYSLKKDWRLNIVKLYRYIQPEIQKHRSDTPSQNHVSNHIDYPKYPTTSIIELMALQSEMRTLLHQIQVPILLMHSKLDNTALPISMPTIYEHLVIKDKDMIWLEKSGHVITLDAEKDFVFQSINQFIQRLIRE